MLILQLEKGEKLPKIEFSQKFSFKERCPNIIKRTWKEKCGNEVIIFYHSLKEKKWTNGTCSKCRWRAPNDLHDYVQPGSPLFKMIYGTDPYAETKARQKQMDREEELRKEALSAKYDKMFTNSDEKNMVKKIVLDEKVKPGEFSNGL